MIDWLEEINLETTGPAISMGVRKLGGRPWLVTDDCMVEELALKAELSKDKSREVFLAYEGTQDAGDIVLSLIQKNGIQLTGMDCNHPLEKAGLSVQEDLCLMQRTAGGWILKGASLSFPSRWQLHKKIGKNLSSIHGPVEGYEKNLSKKVDNFFDRMGDEPVWRRNWFIHPDNSLHQPQRPLNGDPIIKFNQTLPITADKPFIGNTFTTSSYYTINEDIVGATKLFLSSINGLDNQDVWISKRKFNTAISRSTYFKGFF